MILREICNNLQFFVLHNVTYSHFHEMITKLNIPFEKEPNIHEKHSYGRKLDEYPIVYL